MDNFPTIQDRLQMVFKDQVSKAISDNERFVSGLIVDEQIELLRHHGEVTMTPAGDGIIVRLDDNKIERPFIFLRVGKGRMAAHIEGSTSDLIPYIASLFEKSKDVKELFIQNASFSKMERN